MAQYRKDDPESYDRAMKQLVDEAQQADEHFDYQIRRLELGGYEGVPLFPPSMAIHTEGYKEEGGLRFPAEVQIPVPPYQQAGEQNDK